MSALWLALGALALAVVSGWGGYVIGHAEGWDSGRQQGWSDCGTVPEAREGGASSA